jgi:ribosome maturation factor RimP
MFEKIQSLIEGPLKEEKIEVVEIFMEKESGVDNLYIIIDKKPYVDVEVCVLATNIINPILDEADLIKDSYVLNVCSKGGE